MKKIHGKYAQNEAVYSDFIVNQNDNFPSEGKLHAQNGLELKFPFRSSPPCYAKQRTLSPEGKKNWSVFLSWLEGGSGRVCAQDGVCIV